MSFTTSADDVAALLDSLGVDNANVMGFSNGASLAMQLAIRHRGLVQKLVFASAMTKRSGAAPTAQGRLSEGLVHSNDPARRYVINFYSSSEGTVK